MSPILVLAYASASIGGFCLAVAAQRQAGMHARHRRMRVAIRKAESQGLCNVFQTMPESAVIGLIRRAAGSTPPVWLRSAAKAKVWGLGCGDLSGLLAKAGLADTVSNEAVRVLRVRIVCVSLFVGALTGSLFSVELAGILGIGGCIFGFCVIPRALRAQADARNADMERHLSEMVEVLVLGLRSGLSFERSFMLYPRYFQTELGRSMSRVSSQWEMGLITREDALRTLELEYDSPLLSRVVRSMIRSLRFGTSITDSLEAAAIEAREVHRARMEERVAKVAVKMMLPVGALILPAMLLLVLGPVMLELVQGF